MHSDCLLYTSLLAAAVLLAVLLAWEADVDERGRMAAFFTVLGDALALLALQPSCPAAEEDEVTPCPACCLLYTSR